MVRVGGPPEKKPMLPDKKVLERLTELDVGDIRVAEPLREHTTWRIGGPADMLVEPRNVEQLSTLRRYIDDCGCASIVIGDGSNLLFDDAGFRGVVIKVGRWLSAFGIDARRVWGQAGVAVPRLARAVGLMGLTGIEHTIGIPGTLGGLIVMNGGSRRKAIGEVIRTVEVMNCRGEIRSMGRDECDFSYRHSLFQDSNWVVVKAELELEYGDAGIIRRGMLEILRERRRKFPRHLPNCGSVFAGSARLYNRFGPPGKVIEDAGLKGLTVGGAQVSSLHANFIINHDGATSGDILRLIKQVRVAVYDRTEIWMECEVKYVVPTGQIKPVHEVL